MVNQMQQFPLIQKHLEINDQTIETIVRVIG